MDILFAVDIDGLMALLSCGAVTAKKIADSLNAPLRTMDQVSTMGTYPSGNKVTDQPQILFARVDAEKMME